MTTTKTLTAIELIPGKNHINCKYTTVVTDLDGTVLTTKQDGKSYIGDARFSVEIAPTGKPLAEIVAMLNTVALDERDASVAALKVAQDALTASEAKVASLQAQIDAYTPPVVVEPTAVTSVTMRQARLALLGAGLLDDVTAAIAALPEPDRTAATIEFEYAGVVERNSGLIPAMGTALGMTDADLDALFATAKTL